MSDNEGDSFSDDIKGMGKFFGGLFSGARKLIHKTPQERFNDAMITGNIAGVSAALNDGANPNIVASKERGEGGEYIAEKRTIEYCLDHSGKINHQSILGVLIERRDLDQENLRVLVSDAGRGIHSRLGNIVMSNPNLEKLIIDKLISTSAPIENILSRAIKQDNRRVCDLIIGNPAANLEVDQTHDYRILEVATPLSTAIDSNKLSITNRLLDRKDYTPRIADLRHAASKDDNIVKKILNHPKFTAGEQHICLLINQSSNDSRSSVNAAEYLAGHPKTQLMAGKKDKSALVLSASAGLDGVVANLLKRSQELKLRTDMGEFPDAVQAAVNNRHISTIEILERHVEKNAGDILAQRIDAKLEKGKDKPNWKDRFKN